LQSFAALINDIAVHQSEIGQLSALGPFNPAPEGRHLTITDEVFRIPTSQYHMVPVQPGRLAMDKLQIGEIEIVYDRQGDGEWIVFSHCGMIPDGFVPISNNPSLFDYTRLTYHRRGQGESSHPSGTVTTVVHADDLERLMRTLGIRKAHLVGHSFGGAIAIQLAIQAPKLVQTLTICDPAMPSVPMPNAEKFLEDAKAIQARYDSGDKKAAFDDFMSARVGVGWKESIERELPSGTYEKGLRDVDAWFQIDVPGVREWATIVDDDDIKAINKPILRVTGSNSLSIHREVYSLLAEWWSESEGIVLEGANHFGPVDKPKRFVPVLVDFLARHPIE
jgi:pimeloyl-ACP methyl ester carboxylesterase